MTYFAFSLPNRPGELASFTERLRAAGINMLGLWGYAEGEDEPRLSCVPASEEAFRSFCKSERIEFETGRTFYCTGEDQPGALVDTLKKVSGADVNVQGIDAVGTGGQFGCFIWAAESDWEAIEKILT